MSQNSAELADNIWLTKLVYLSNLYSELNRLNSSMQGRNTHAIQLCDRIEGFLEKIKTWRDQTVEGTFSMFPSVEEMSESVVLSPTAHSCFPFGRPQCWIWEILF